jgi:hypothetical protein
MAGAGYKLFNTGDVLTAAQVNTYLQEQTVMVFASSAARTSALSGVLAEGMMSYLQDTNAVEVYNGSAWVGVGGGMTNPMTTTGDVIYSSSGSTPARLGIGTAGQVLKVNSGATAPEWGSVAGGGKVLQVIQGLKSDTFSTTSTSFTDVTGLSVTITPSSATSKILVIGQVSVGNIAKDGATPATSILRLVRASTTIFAGDAASSRSLGFTGVMYADQINNSANPFNFLDSPATTSSTTYKIQMLTSNASSTTYVNRSFNDGDAASVTRAASSIIVLEIGA